LILINQGLISLSMQTDLRNCLRCQQEFHPINNIPRILYACGHTFCSQCIREILDIGSCPFDSTPVPPDTLAEQIPVNPVILAMLPSLCQRHHKPEDLICLREYRRICSDCKEECLFQRHNIRILRDIEAEAEKKKQSLQAIADEFDSEYEEIDTLLNDKEEALIKEVDNTFESFKEAIESTKNKIHSAVRKLFEEQKTIADESYNHDDQLKKQANHLLHVLNEKAFDQNFFNALRTHVGSLQISSQKPRIDAVVNVIDNHTEAIRVELIALLARIPTLLNTKDHHSIEDFKIEENEENGEHISAPTEILDEIPFEQEQPRIEESAENYQRVASLFNAEIEEGNNRLILSFKNQREDMETESLLNDQEKLQTVSKVTLNINKSHRWKEAIQSLQWIWSRLGKVIDFKVDFSFKGHAKDLLKALVKQSNVWATTDLSEFTIDLLESKVQDKTVKKLYEKAISKMTNLQKLEIVLESTKITDKSIQDFADQTLPKLTSLTDFRFYIDNTKVSDETMEKLLTSIHNNKKNLTGLAFGLDDTAVTDKTIANFAKNISPFASELTKLDFSAKKTNITDDSLKVLFESLNSHLNNLKEFTLDLGCTNVSNEGLKSFFQSTLPKMTDLEVFELFLNEQKKITNKIIKPIAKSLHSLTNLKKICLELGGTETGGKTLDALEKYALKNKPVLEIFELYVAETKIKDVDINNFFLKIEKEQTFKNLRTLSFCFSKLHVTDDGCELLAKSIQACEHLQILKLQLGKTKVTTDKGLEYLSHGINQVLQRTKLTEFQLYLDSTGVTDQGLKVLSNQVVRNLIGVKSFELCLSRLQGVTDHGVEVLLRDLSTVAGSLERVDLNLHETRITDDCLKVLSHTLWSTKMNLESFALCVGKNKCITDNSFEWCLSGFAGVLKNLKKLALGVEETKISQKGLGLLKNYLNENPNALEKIEIEVGDDKSLQKIVKDLQVSLCDI